MGDGCLPSADPQKFIISLTTPFWYTRRKEVVILCCFSLPFVSCLTVLVAYKVEANVNKQPNDGRPSTNGDEGGKAFLQRTTQSHHSDRFQIYGIFKDILTVLSLLAQHTSGKGTRHTHSANHTRLLSKIN